MSGPDGLPPADGAADGRPVDGPEDDGAARAFARWAVLYAGRAAASPPGTRAGVLRGDLALVAARAEIALRGGPGR